jgi:hypothetical protein
MSSLTRAGPRHFHCKTLRDRTTTQINIVCRSDWWRLSSPPLPSPARSIGGEYLAPACQRRGLFYVSRPALARRQSSVAEILNWVQADPGGKPNRRMDAMNEASIGFDLNDEEILAYEVSDDGLEAAGCTGPDNVKATVTMCTKLEFRTEPDAMGIFFAIRY